MSDFRLWPFCACAVHLVIIIGTVGSLWTWLWGRYHVPQNVFLVCFAVSATLKFCPAAKGKRAVFCDVLLYYSETETVTITGLSPFTQYKFSVSSSNMPLYNITSCRTAEGCKSYC